MMTDDNPMRRQVGGNHYSKLAIQPAEYTHANGLGHMEGDAIAYITRWRSKNGIDDLRKAVHSIELLIHLETEKELKQIQDIKQKRTMG
jgi:hypothetical protein